MSTRPTPKKKRQPTEQRRAELTAAALAIIANKGIASLTTRALADEVGLTSGAIFRHFPTLDALLDAVVAEVETVMDGTYPPPELPARERLERFVLARSSAVGARVGILRLVLSEQFSLALPEAGSARLESCITRTKAFLVECIAEAQRDGSIRDDVDAPSLAVIVMGTMRMLALGGAPGAARRPSVPMGGVTAALWRLLAPARVSAAR